MSKEGQTASVSLQFKSCSNTLMIFIFPLLLTKVFLNLFLLSNLGEASALWLKIETETLSRDISHEDRFLLKVLLCRNVSLN